MKISELKKTVFCVFVTFFCLLLSTSGVHSSESPIATMDRYYTGYFTNFSLLGGNNFYMDSSGNLHAAVVNNYELYYLSSTGDGASWTSEKIATGHEGT